jgi:hypothetical protein
MKTQRLLNVKVCQKNSGQYCTEFDSHHIQPPNPSPFHGVLDLKESSLRETSISGLILPNICWNDQLFSSGHFQDFIHLRTAFIVTRWPLKEGTLDHHTWPQGHATPHFRAHRVRKGALPVAKTQVSDRNSFLLRWCRLPPQIFMTNWTPTLWISLIN